MTFTRLEAPMLNTATTYLTWLNSFPAKAFGPFVKISSENTLTDVLWARSVRVENFAAVWIA